jgi:hypothetical protein
MQSGCPSQVPNCPIQRSTRHPNLCTCHKHRSCAIVTCDGVTTSITVSPNQWGIQ